MLRVLVEPESVEGRHAFGIGESEGCLWALCEEGHALSRTTSVAGMFTNVGCDTNSCYQGYTIDTSLYSTGDRFITHHIDLNDSDTLISEWVRYWTGCPEAEVHVDRN